MSLSIVRPTVTILARLWVALLLRCPSTLLSRRPPITSKEACLISAAIQGLRQPLKAADLCMDSFEAGYVRSHPPTRCECERTIDTTRDSQRWSAASKWVRSTGDHDGRHVPYVTPGEIIVVIA